jgi:heat shock protein HslJ
VNRCKPLAIRRPVGLIVVTALVLAACGGEDAADETTTTTTSTSIATTSTTTDSDGGTTQPGAVAPELVGTSWSVVMYNLAASMTNPWPGTELTLRFGNDGTVSGSTGCNEYSSTFEVEGPYDEFVEGQRDENDGQVIRFGALTITERACAESRYMEQEAEFVDLLEQVGRWFVGRGSLILRSADASWLIEAEPIG